MVNDRATAPPKGGLELFSESLTYGRGDIYSHVQNLEFEK
jgi:hypothetical protein